MSNLLIKFFKEQQLALKNKLLVIAVSTGLDSMVLLNEAILAQQDIDFKIVVAHVNHQIRQQSIEEEQFITSYCQAHNLELRVKKLDKSLITGNFQNNAREFRYQFFKEVVDEFRANYLLLAHHANDNIETILMRLLRGSNLRGYAGMEKVIVHEQYLIIRPLLDILKEDLIKIAKMKKIHFYEDETNQTNIYTRNRIREDIVPSFFKENANVHKQFAHFSDLLISADNELRKAVTHFIENYVILNEDVIEIDRLAFLHENLFMQKEILFTLTKKVFLGQKNIDEILKLINSKKPNIISKVTSKLTFVREYEKISLIFKALEFKEVNLKISQCGEYEIDEKRKIVVAKKSDKNILKNNSLWYNMSMLPVFIRSRKDGDRIELLSGTKKVSDLLIDKKVGILQREQILLIEDMNKNILAVLGVAESKQIKNLKESDLIITLKEKD